MDDPDNIDIRYNLGSKAAGLDVRAEDFPSRFDLAQT